LGRLRKKLTTRERLIGRLALAAGGDAVRAPFRWAAGMDERAFQFWRRFDAEEPFGPRALNLMLAVACALSEKGNGRVSDYLLGNREGDGGGG
jgi:hypothetical protein